MFTEDGADARNKHKFPGRKISRKEEGKMFKEIKINSRPSHQEIAMFPSLRKFQRQKWHPSQSLRGNGKKGLGSLLTELLQN